MKKFITFFLATSIAATTLVAENQYSVYVDKSGVMRRDDTNAEVSFYGTNYTVPFAHAYRALGYLGIDRKEAIRRDVYHMARLGFNAFRLHLWDVELTDSLGNLQNNDHLDLLDFLINELESRGISIILTAQTNFGNGYPEKNIDTGAYSYDHDKCDIHADKTAQAKQARYLGQLVNHINNYTGKSYAEDRSIIAMEINNEPCHNAKSADVTAYINKMVKAMRSGKWQKPILYNVSHNRQVVDAYYKADIQGTTYQWYPIHLVAGHMRKGNFLPFVDQYDIPFSDVKGFNNKAKVVYEFDPADILYSYMYPAIARTFRKEGFQWITQFAYDPIDMAWANTEYQTHYLNLAFTPSKAISMKIAAEVARNVERGADYGKYPADTIFSGFRVSYKEDLSEYNNGTKFLYSNTTSTRPTSPISLTEIAGVGTSPIVSYDGSGAYFIDRINDSTWRLEVMPDVLFSKDPFEKPSLSRRVADILYAEHPMTIELPQLGSHYIYRAINSDNDRQGQAVAGTFNVYPGVYLLSQNDDDINAIDTNSTLNNIRLSEYVAPEKRNVDLTVVHTPAVNVEAGTELTIRATVYGSTQPDSVLVYPAEVSFWNEHNRLYKMNMIGSYVYETKILVNNGRKDCTYNIVAFTDGKSLTYPGAISGSPLDWDYCGKDYFRTEVYQPGAPIVLLEPAENNGSEFSTIPEAWGGSFYGFHKKSPIATDCMHLHARPSETATDVIVYKRVAEILESHHDLSHDRKLVLRLGNVSGTDSVTISIVNIDGMTFSATKPITQGTIEVSLDELQLTSTPLAPSPYPVFLTREFIPSLDYTGTPDWSDMEQIIIGFPAISVGTDLDAEIEGVWLK